MELLLTLLIWLYYQCAFFMLNLARLFGVTYRDTNAFVFFILWPVLTLGLALVGVWNSYRLWRMQRMRQVPKR